MCRLFKNQSCYKGILAIKSSFDTDSLYEFLHAWISVNKIEKGSSEEHLEQIQWKTELFWKLTSEKCKGYWVYWVLFKGVNRKGEDYKENSKYVLYLYCY